ncbi:type IV toxin-antitoxin system AbiEi family antitoxin domain-containing protein [Corynebacterium propinquum]|jgi:hypothetical protein|uniref:Type IV toxin-antitoxin system AbiEi family antitoxin domain-containing protein n=1 Tax=Corynebacterium propinquum TaxID=43769 RepID=A0ABT7G248_9CORY|nr:type IV toxin-antitoxin system AbiEi family antitoxin domain-containing protein [Corynebacterium propinquum]MCT1818191.1 type IV toxin-antitoxin system AbiEi family antitoxin domain-containing protein [Corynebacterium propinquum]MDK4234866.1 type IV toxin-antitoxin system AbiEi family antitoxin domain-containing protein [Corynebacterium propinquum]MDK4293189.1 type IV toxin-antitoxin system AbiEi family antitoxin domain-containing protein [Corynebacterium propinquum]MDK4300797.1 type IV toxi
MKTAEAIELTADLATQQWGLFTSAQARAKGIDAVTLNRLVNKSLLTRLRHGIYAFAATLWTPELDVRVQWLALDPATMAIDRIDGNDNTTVVSHETAASLYGIGDLQNEKINFTTKKRRQTKQPEVIFHIAALSNTDITYLDGLPITTIPRTVRDLLASGHEPAHVTDIITAALQDGLISREDLSTQLADVATLLGARENTAVALRTRLNELVPLPAGEDPVVQAVLDTLEKLSDSAISAVLNKLKPVEFSPEIRKNLQHSISSRALIGSEPNGDE